MTVIKAKYLDSHCVVDDAGRVANLQSCLQRGLQVCKQLPERDSPLAIVGSGPSLSDHIDELRDWPGEVWAVNGAYDFLLSVGLIADGMVAIDPLPGMAEYLQNPQPETCFYIASTCDPSVFDVLEGHNVQIWHGATEDNSVYPADARPVYGGTTVVTRAPFLALMLGWRDITLFGVDSSYSEAGPYCYQWGTYKEDIKEPTLPIMINGEGPFYSEIGLLKQISQIHAMLGMLNKKREILKIRSAGLMDAYLRSPMLDDSAIEVIDGNTDTDSAGNDGRQALPD